VFYWVLWSVLAQRLRHVVVVVVVVSAAAAAAVVVLFSWLLSAPAWTPASTPAHVAGALALGF